MQILLGGEAPYIPRFMQINHQAIFEPSEAGFFQLVFDDGGSWKPPEAKNVVKKLAKNWFNFKAFNQWQIFDDIVDISEDFNLSKAKRKFNFGVES